MDSDPRLARAVAMDLEVSAGGRIHRIGALRGAATFARSGRFDLPQALRELDEFARGAPALIGHNLLGHDLPHLRGALPRLRLLKLPVVDTLYLSPLAFPENPYHHLVKGHKLVRQELNDPIADARLSTVLLADELDAIRALAQSEPGVASLYRYCFAASPGTDDLFFDALGIPNLRERAAIDIAAGLFARHGCASVSPELAREFLGTRRHRLSSAYAAAWLRVAGGNSIVPHWVDHAFPAVHDLLSRLRGAPCYDRDCAYCRDHHDPTRLLNRFFGFPSFRGQSATPDGRPFQEEVVRQGIAGRPLLAILPTGGGKSLCFQLPALARNAQGGDLTVVISPLQALMKDQVDGLRARTGTPFAGTINGMLTPPERADTLQRLVLGDLTILYVSPEQFRNPSFRRKLLQRRIGGWVFDEAHCLSKWGHEFRPDYLYAGRFIREFSEEQGVEVAPIFCFTATAKRDVTEEIVDYFKRELGQELTVFEAGVERENLNFDVHLVHSGEKHETVHNLLSDQVPKLEDGSAVVFRATRAGAEETAEYLKHKDWSAEAFHAGLDAPRKRRIQDDFIGGDIQVICATNAFGMGIDKEDVRLVIHADIPGSLENYIQEAGRAGRDNQDAACVLLYDEQDSERQFQLGAYSELSRHDIAQILRGIRRAAGGKREQLVITAGELLRDEQVETSFDAADTHADTKVRTAVAWLERAGFVERNENRTTVFQGTPRVASREEAEARVAKLKLSPRRATLWLSILGRFFAADPDEGITEDEIAGLPAFEALFDPVVQEASAGPRTHTSRVMRELGAMVDAGLLDNDLLLTAFVRYKVIDHSRLRFDRVSAFEQAMLNRMREEEPDPEGWMNLSLRRLNQFLRDDGFADTRPDLVQSLLRSLSFDGKGLAGSHGSIDLRYVGFDQYRVKFRRGWPALLETARRRRAVAGVVVDTLLDRVPDEAAPNADQLVQVSMNDLVRAVRGDLAVAGALSDADAAVERALLYLHEQRVIILQQGLAVFRQAMSIQILPENKGRPYTRADFSPLHQHHRERVFQVHVMNEYARRGLEQVRGALEMVLAYFSMPKAAFVERYFQSQEKMLEFATTADSYRKIVDTLNNPHQVAAVSGRPDENLLILAGPGSGKTRTVVHRAAYLLRVMRVPSRAILVVAFNRSAATALRRRLWDLVGPDARGVTIQTYHGLAMRLTGASFAARAEAGHPPPDFETLISDAIDLLQDHGGRTGADPDEIRDRVLAGYQHILVDEYQDIDGPQYELISAIAGRSRSDPDTRLSVLAVGDDDQNIYTFRGANVEFIRRFEQDYHARSAFLLESYRSSAHILAAANAIIHRNRDRMKVDHPIRINRIRRHDPAGGRWAERDAPVTRGRVQILEVTDAVHQAISVVDEIQRLLRLDPDLAPGSFAVLSRTHHDLEPIRARCEQAGIPVRWVMDRGSMPPLHRFREFRAALGCLHARAHDPVRVSELIRDLQEVAGGQAGSAWWRLVFEILEEWRRESGDAEQPAQAAADHIYEAITDFRLDQVLGEGVHLGTVHSAKGLEFPHVLITGGGWRAGRDQREQEEERRVLYVGMTRAEETLHLLERADAPQPFLAPLSGRYVFRRKAPDPGAEERHGLDLKYALLGMSDLNLSYASRFPGAAPIHQHLADLVPGMDVRLQPHRDRIAVQTRQGQFVAVLSRMAQDTWRPRLATLDQARILAMVQRRKTDGERAEFEKYCRVEQWEVPLLELRYRE